MQPDPVDEVDVAQTRAVLDTMAAHGPPPLPVGVVEDGRLGGVAVRTFHPPAPVGTTLVWAHGGGWVAGTLDVADPLCRLLVQATGRTVVAVDYRLAPEHPFPAGLEDLLAVLDALNGPVAVGGDSAGGALAAVAARLRSGLTAQVLLCPLLDATLSSPSVAARATGFGLTRRTLEQFVELYGGDPADTRVSPLLAPDLAGVAPAVVVTGGLDPLAGDGERYVARLRAAGVTVAHRCWAGAGHGFVGMGSADSDQALAWLGEQLT